MVKPTSGPPKFAQPTISERERLHPPKRDPADRRSRISHSERESILIRMLAGLSAPRIGREMGLGGSTVRDAIRDMQTCPSLLLLMRVFELGKAGGRSWWKCLICGTTSHGSRSAALQHILNEVLPAYPAWFRDPRRLSYDMAITYLALVRRLPRQLREDPASVTLSIDDAHALLAKYNLPIPPPRRWDSTL